MSEIAGMPARIAAQSILFDVLHKRRPLDAALDACAGLETRDAGFARAIASETLRRLGQLDALIRAFTTKLPPPHRAGPVFEILLAGACELLFLEVAPHAAVDAANRLAQVDGKAVHFKALVNAVLRRVSREGAEVIATQDAARLNTPDWLWTRWVDAYGEEITRAIAAAHTVQAPLDITTKESAPPFANAAAIFPNVFRVSDPGRVDAMEGFAGGGWFVQDAAASLPARLFGDVRGATVIDLCAAPGGKTAQLAALGARVIAVEREADRMARLKENLERLQLEATLIVGDMRDFKPEPAPFVLLDAPCTATGTIRRHPELPWIKGAQDINFCAQAAAELLDSAVQMVAPGGLLVFAVCSLEPEEGSLQTEDFLRRHKDFRREAVTPQDVFGHSELIDGNGDLRTLPCHLGAQGGMDGFYAARLRRS